MSSRMINGLKTKTGEIIVQYIKTTAGKVILNNTIQKTLTLFD